MRFSTVPKRPTSHVTHEELINDLLMALRDVVARESYFAVAGTNQTQGPQFDKLRITIAKVIDLHGRLSSRGVQVDKALEDASEQIGIDLKQLLQDCLQFPSIIPFARNLQGLRRLFLCHCGEKEAFDRHGLGLCFNCLEVALECIRAKKRHDKFILYTSYSPQVRCRHADFNTLLVTFNKPGLWPPAWCEICLQQEKERIKR